MVKPAQARLMSYLQAVERFVLAHGADALVSSVVSEGLPIGQWMNMQRAQHRKGRLSDWLRAQLERLPGWTATRGLQVGREHRTRTTIQHHLEVLRQHVRCGRPITEIESGSRGGSFRAMHVYFVKMKARGELPEDVRRELEAMPGWSWAHAGAHRDRDVLELLKAAAARGDSLVFGPSTVVDGVKLGQWIRGCHRRRR